MINDFISVEEQKVWWKSTPVMFDGLIHEKATDDIVEVERL